jgi:hypothetical protein
VGVSGATTLRSRVLQGQQYYSSGCCRGNTVKETFVSVVTGLPVHTGRFSRPQGYTGVFQWSQDYIQGVSGATVLLREVSGKTGLHRGVKGQ